MNKTELAKDFSAIKLAEIRIAIEDAFIAGFDAGILSLKSQSRTINGVRFEDLSLPSGTLWSSCSIDCVYPDTIDINIPTIDQWKELAAYCKFFRDSKYARYNIVGPNGKEIHFLGGSSQIDTWIPQDSSTQKEKSAINLQKLFCNLTYFTESIFSGEKLPVFIVAKKG